MKNQLVKSIGLLSMVNLIAVLVPLAIFPYVYSKVGSAGYGEYLFCQTIVLIMGLIVDFGFNQANLHILKTYNKVYPIAISTLIIKLALTFFSFLIFSIIVTSVKVNSELAWLTFTYIFGNVFSPVWLYQIKGDYRIYSYVNISFKILSIPLILFFVGSIDDLDQFIIIQSSVFVSSNLLSFLIAMFKLKLIKIESFEFSIWWHFHKSFLYFIQNVSSSIYTLGINLVVAKTCGYSGLGVYAVFDRIVSGIQSFFNPVITSYYAALSKEKSKDNRVKILSSLSKGSILISITIVAVLNLTTSYYFPFFNNSELYNYKLVFLILSSLLIWRTLSAIYGVLGILNEGKVGMWNKITLVSVILGLTLIYLSASFWGLIGAVVVWSIVEIAILITSFLTYKFLHV